jgi:hypothetical protein
LLERSSHRLQILLLELMRSGDEERGDSETVGFHSLKTSNEGGGGEQERLAWLEDVVQRVSTRTV